METVVFVVICVVGFAFLCYVIWKFACNAVVESSRCPNCGSLDVTETSRVWNMSFSETVTRKCKRCGHVFKFMLCD